MTGGTASRPEFMTLAMWFAWLLRQDARDGAPIDDAEAQREFVIWWLLVGRGIYPGAWWYGPAQQAVAMEPVAAGNGTGLPRLLHALHRRGPGLPDGFPLDGAEDAADFCCWYRLSGATTLPTAPALPPRDAARTEAASGRPKWTAEGTSVPRMAVAMWRANPALRQRFDAGSANGRKALAAWYAAHGRSLVPAPSAAPSWPEVLPPPASGAADGLERGVNIVGYPNERSGIGEDARMLTASLAEAGIATISVDVAPRSAPGSAPGSATKSTAPEAQLRYDATVFCLNPFDTARLFLERGPALFAGRRNIGYWPWELPIFPPVWRGTFALVDEIWAASAFTAEAMRASADKPVRTLPPAVAAGERARLTRRELGLPEDCFLFVYPFDPKSFLVRKNPEAAAAAFRRAFPPVDDRVRLVFRANGDPSAAPGWDRVLQTISGDPRIVIETRCFDRATALGYVGCCDCVVSPHRAEGFGRNLAEALAMEIAVIATGFSGCLDFLAPDETVRWARREVSDDDYPFGEGAWWAEPDIGHLAARMRAVRRAMPSARAARARRRAQADGAAVRSGAGRATLRRGARRAASCRDRRRARTGAMSKAAVPTARDELAELRAEVERLRAVIDDMTDPDGVFQAAILRELAARAETFAAEQRAFIAGATRALAEELAAQRGRAATTAGSPPPKRSRRT